MRARSESREPGGQPSSIAAFRRPALAALNSREQETDQYCDNRDYNKTAIDRIHLVGR
jgi:hypothetical protein